MVATTTVSSSLLSQLRRDFPEIIFKKGPSFRWSPSEKTVFYANTLKKNHPILLHETAHGILGHAGYTYDIDLIKLERDAWEKAKTIGSNYDVKISEDAVEDALDSYRDWLHARSLCPKCYQNGVQTGPTAYTCVLCSRTWRVNEAKVCGLKRKIVSKTTPMEG